MRLLSPANVRMILCMELDVAQQWVSEAAYGLQVGSVRTQRLVLADPDSPLLSLPTLANIQSLPATQLADMVQRSARLPPRVPRDVADEREDESTDDAHRHVDSNDLEYTPTAGGTLIRNEEGDDREDRPVQRQKRRPPEATEDHDFGMYKAMAALALTNSLRPAGSIVRLQWILMGLLLTSASAGGRHDVSPRSPPPQNDHLAVRQHPPRPSPRCKAGNTWGGVRILFVHRKTKHNLGDHWSTPFHYFDWRTANRTEVMNIGWGASHGLEGAKSIAAKLPAFDLVIVGGGGLLGLQSSSWNVTLDSIARHSGVSVIWAAGINYNDVATGHPLLKAPEYINRFHLVAICDQHVVYADGGEDSDEVPQLDDASCMHPSFGKVLKEVEEKFSGYIDGTG
jgi:hypothetical protein